MLISNYKKIKATFSQSEFFRNVLTLSSGTAVAQALPILISPILTRLYTPEQFATLGLFTACISIFGVISTGKYEFALMLSKTDEELKSVFALSTIVTFSLSFIILILIVVFHSTLLIFFNNADFSVWLYFIPLGIFLTGIFQVLNFLNNRNKAYTTLVKSRVVRSLITSSVNVLLGFVRVGIKTLQSAGLVAAQLVGQLVEIVMLKPPLGWYREVNALQIREAAKRYINFPRFDVPSELMVTASVQLPILLLNRFFESATVGFYFQANRILSLPMSMVGSSIGQVLFRQLSECREDPALFSEKVKKTYSNLALISAVPFTITGLFGEVLFGFVFGKEWATAGVYAALISPWLLFNFIGSPLTIIFSVLEKQRNMFYWICSMFVVRISALFAGIVFFQNVFYAVLFFSLAGAVSYFFLNFYLVCVLSRVSTAEFLKSTFGKPLIVIIVFVLIRISIIPFLG